MTEGFRSGGGARSDGRARTSVDTLDRPMVDLDLTRTGRSAPGRLGAVATRTATLATPKVVTPGPAPASFGYHRSIDGLRALAVLVIIAFHFDYRWARGGFLGVDLFFVLSGFLITTLLITEWNRSGTLGFAGFWARRARRLLPALLITLVGVAAFTHFAVVPWSRVSIRNDGLASLAYVANWRFIAAEQGYFNLFSAPSPLRHMWSLAVEEQFYLVWPLVTYGALRLGRGSLKLLGAICALGTVASVVAMARAFDHGDLLRAYYGTDTRAHTVLLGALLAVAHARWPARHGRRDWLGLAGLVALVIAAVMMATATGESWRYYHGGSLLFGLLSAVLIAAILQPGALTTALGCRPLAWIGRLSYALYIFHWPIIVWVVPSRVPVGPLTLNLIRLGLTFAAAIASYHLVELPIRERRFLARLPRSTPLIAADRQTLRMRLTLVGSGSDMNRLLAVPVIAVVVGFVFLSATGAGPAPNYLAGSTTPPSYATAPASAGTPAAAAPSAARGPILSGSTTDYTDAERPPELDGVIWAMGDPLFCGNPPPKEDFTAVRTARRLGPPKVSATADATRILVLGDSTACSIFPGLRAVGAQVGIDVEQGAVFGCGMVTAQPTSVRGDELTPHAERCPFMVRTAHDRAVAQVDPDIVVWMSTWEKADLIIKGKVLESGTPAGDDAMLDQMDDTLARITVGGAHVVIVTSAAPGPNDADLTDGARRRVAEDGYARLGRLQRRFAERHPDQVTLVDLASHLCPGGPPCPDQVDGIEARPDGRHFTPEAAAIQSRWLLPRILAAPR